jgi:hypothetical protein
MPSRVRALLPAALVTVVLAACSDSATPPTAAASRIAKTVASDFPVAQATIRVLSALSATGGFAASSINDSDEVVGNSSLGPFKWTPAHGLQYLSVGNFPNTPAAIAVNDNGVIIGAGGDTTRQAVVWLPDGTIRLLPKDTLSKTLPQPASCGPVAINIYAQIVGACNSEVASIEGVIYNWHAPAVASPIAQQFTSISDDGWMGGQLKNGGPFVQSSTGEVVTLYGHDNMLHANGSWVNAVTRHGYAAGQSDEGGCLQAVAWLYAAGQHWPEFRMGVCGTASGITPDWYVVGTAWDPNFTPASQFAFVWFPEKGTQQLPGLSQGIVTSAVAVNSSHHVLGTIGSQVVIWNVGPR